MRHIEDNIQIACVRWFSMQYPRLALCLHHSPNGGKRDAREAARFKEMGTRPGFPDLFLMYPANAYHGLFVEMKSPKGVQQQSQKQWQSMAESLGYRYIVCRSLEEFMNVIRDYLCE